MLRLMKRVSAGALCTLVPFALPLGASAFYYAGTMYAVQVKAYLDAPVDPEWSFSYCKANNLNLHDMVLDACSGIFFFKVLGGSFHRVLPSDLRSPGVYAHQSLPPLPAEPAEDAALLAAFRRDGCHHCGHRKGTPIRDYIASLQEGEVQQRTASAADAPLAHAAQQCFAQCESCSRKKAELLRPRPDGLGARNPVVMSADFPLDVPGVVPGLLVGLRAFVLPVTPVAAALGAWSVVGSVMMTVVAVGGVLDTVDKLRQ